MNALKVLSASGTQLKGTLPNKGWCELRKLQELMLIKNQLDGTLPPCLKNLTSLNLVDLSQNRLIANIGLSSPLSALTSLKYLLIFGNSFEIPSSFRFFANHTKLRGIHANGNKAIITEIELQREIPKELVIGCSSLMVLKLSNNKLEGEIVQEFGYLSSLEYFYLDGNNFTSTISDSLSNIPFCILDISNKFSGKIPRWMGHITSLEQLSLSQNHLEGPIPIEFCNLEHLSVLDLSKNTLIGSIPPCLNPSSIKHVHLSKNQLGDQFTPAFFNSTALVIFDISHNNFVGVCNSRVDRQSLRIEDSFPQWKSI
nr:LRR receptor-like serine/threonine-protein kinase FLS2 [Ipomoea batatas]